MSKTDRFVLIPFDRELRERLVWFIHLRWLAVAGMGGTGWLVYVFFNGTFSPWPLWMIGMGVALYNGLFSLIWHRRDVSLTWVERFCGIVYVQIALDWVALSFLIYHLGGIQSPVAYAFVFHLLIGAILLSKGSSYILAVIASSTIGLLAIVENFVGGEGHVVARVHIDVWPSFSGEFYRWGTLSGIFLISGFLTSSITEQLRNKERGLFASEQALDRAYGKMEALYELGQGVNASSDLAYILGMITERGTLLMEMKACSVQLLNDGGQRLHVGRAFGLSEAYVHKGAVDVEKSSLAARVLSGQVIQVADVMADPQGLQYPEKARAEGIRSVLCVPMQVKDRAIGVIRVYSNTVHQFSEEEINFARNLANLGAVAIESARTYAELKALSDEKTWFARTTAHQLRSPLATIDGLLEALPYAGDLSAKQMAFIDRCRRRLQDPLDMIRDLLELASVQQKITQQGEPIELVACLESVLDTMEERAQTKGVQFDIRLDRQAYVLAQAEDLRRIFSNLVDNAIKYTPVGGTVTFELGVRDQEVTVMVSDTGLGIAKEDHQRIFDSFYRTQASKASGEVGSGLGLAIVAQLVERWGGHICVESQPTQGSCFKVSLPATPRP